ncbi:MAG: hypothetical protein GZ094_18365 [Mariniphaga sp.]|nr:hypothetical protein [Mariniphaga sp.]
MKLVKHSISGFIFLFASIVFFSCNLEDFNLNKLSKTNNLIPDVFAPLAYGTFKVSDLAPVFKPDDYVPITVSGMDLSPAIISKLGTTFNSAAIDKIYLITQFTNNTLCDLDFDLSFADASGIQSGQSYPGMIPAGAMNEKIIFPLDRLDQDNLQNAISVKFSFKIKLPSNAANPILYGAVKSQSFTIKISFHAPVELQKL